MKPTINDIKQAAARIRPYVRETPVMTSDALNKMTRAELFFKCENFQKTGAFKIRGATNALLSLSPEKLQHGVATHSSGNHGAALALAAKNLGIPAYIVMPNDSPQVKQRAVTHYGAHITFCKPGIVSRLATLQDVLRTTGAIAIPPFDDTVIIAGQGTIALELLAQTQNLQMVVVPVGGGGLIAGMSIALHALAPDIKVIGAEPDTADDATQSFQQKTRVTQAKASGICDGLLVTVGEITFPIMMKYVHTMMTVKEKTILLAMKLIWERLKIVVEPSAAIALAVILENPDYFRGRRVGVILSGGNVDVPAIASRWPR